jgi:hypothetical protein
VTDTAAFSASVGDRVSVLRHDPELAKGLDAGRTRGSAIEPPKPSSRSSAATLAEAIPPPISRTS